ncbi:hypothetical protein BX667DRAFT_516086 [Coemansia mojavensis]|nr:hypothetical protein BX667DRAFT_516086 [Coemansia mojavensis]
MLSNLAEQPALLPTVKDHSASPEHLEMSSGQAGAFPTAGPNPVVAAEPAGMGSNTDEYCKKLQTAA